MSIKTDIYSFSDIPEKSKYLIKRLKEIYPTTNEKEIKKILDSIKIKFREQKERGASNYKKRTVYLPLYDFEKFFLKNKNDVLKYLENPKSTVTHETIHIFQNLSGSFPDIKYLEKQPNGEFEIDYGKYWNDPGEKQSRLEQVRELLNWGMTKSEIVQFLYNRKHDDRKLWERIVDHAIEQKK
ncbi:MAG: hypothetical protein PHF86_04480 [Candidatus Nanoarchaeia archaeon]|jgi:hypothetical protein|nr:hypothetical protein [Candidatus Nanoarchaeia archaeon]